MTTINIIGLAIILLIVWWFWLYRPKPAVKLQSNLVITVENGVYTPAFIQINAMQQSQLTFHRKDPSPCASSIVIPAADFSIELPLNKSVSLTLPPLAKGEYEFHCPMKMYSGKIRAD
ncbi:cupredoxin domain-containing protein [Neiella marina]|uniref:Cupredoxin domain-containing protein n=1 Tax=Neiella holothuriorum TaxID=2870530 RepID=A0ABS7EF08_9GAMM|nr:cupredoxin domain-containing protein [Neiella holothuriorum]MBW8190941.1 cupredoxin domain-containing protein [Neiella holothuriorum]